MKLSKKAVMIMLSYNLRQRYTWSNFVMEPHNLRPRIRLQSSRPASGRTELLPRVQREEVRHKAHLRLDPVAGVRASGAAVSIQSSEQCFLFAFFVFFLAMHSALCLGSTLAKVASRMRKGNKLVLAA